MVLGKTTISTARKCRCPARRPSAGALGARVAHRLTLAIALDIAARKLRAVDRAAVPDLQLAGATPIAAVALAPRRVIARDPQLLARSPFALRAWVHESEHALSWQSVLQSAPATQVHAVSLHVQPSPVHSGGRRKCTPHGSARSAGEHARRASGRRARRDAARHRAFRARRARRLAIAVAFDVARRRIRARDGAVRAHLDLADRLHVARRLRIRPELEIAVRRRGARHVAMVAAGAFALRGVVARHADLVGRFAFALRRLRAHERARAVVTLGLAVGACFAFARAIGARAADAQTLRRAAVASTRQHRHETQRNKRTRHKPSAHHPPPDRAELQCRQGDSPRPQRSRKLEITRACRS